jgi:hypothetical protein
LRDSLYAAVDHLRALAATPTDAAPS